MTCNICGVNEATIHLTEIINDQMVEIHLCESCAQEKGTDFKTHFNFGDLPAGLTDSDIGVSSGAKKEASACPKCAMTYEQFGKTGRLGCPACYEAFSSMLLPLIKRVQRSTAHIGKRPARLNGEDQPSDELKVLQERLRKSVETEAFEEAARLRDEIRKVEQKIKKDRKK